MHHQHDRWVILLGLIAEILQMLIDIVSRLL